MTRLILCLCSIVMVFFTEGYAFAGASRYLPFTETAINTNISLSVSEALDMVKEKYAANFEKVYYESAEGEKSDSAAGTAEYYYKLPFADYYLVYEGQGETKKDYLFHLYEFVLDEPDTGLGHTVTYGWYTVDSKTGIITDQLTTE